VVSHKEEQREPWRIEIAWRGERPIGGARPRGDQPGRNQGGRARVEEEKRGGVLKHKKRRGRKKKNHEGHKRHNLPKEKIKPLARDLAREDGSIKSGGEAEKKKEKIR